MNNFAIHTDIIPRSIIIGWFLLGRFHEPSNFLFSLDLNFSVFSNPVFKNFLKQCFYVLEKRIKVRGIKMGVKVKYHKINGGKSENIIFNILRNETVWIYNMHIIYIYIKINNKLTHFINPLLLILFILTKLSLFHVYKFSSGNKTLNVIQATLHEINCVCVFRVPTWTT